MSVHVTAGSTILKLSRFAWYCGVHLHHLAAPLQWRHWRGALGDTIEFGHFKRLKGISVWRDRGALVTL